jgi:hypothetical protein
MHARWALRSAQRGGLVLALAIGLIGCGGPLSSAIGLPRVVDREPRPEDRRVSIDDVTMSEDQRTAHLSFTGGPPWDPNDPCATDYVAVGDVRDDVLEVAVIETVSSGEGWPEPPPDAPLLACNAMGHPHSVRLALPEAFTGSTVRDLSGQVFFVSVPDGLVALAGLPDGWALRSEGDVEGSPTGRWQRQYVSSDGPSWEDNRGVLDLYQAFGGPVMVSGGDEQQSVAIGPTTGTLYRELPSGELVLTWELDGTALAIVANESDFTPAALIELAASAVLP